VDTSSQLTPQEVSGIAGAIDMPVYVVAVDTTATEGELTNLARWSGGALYRVSNTADGSVAARQIVSELRHQRHRSRAAVIGWLAGSGCSRTVTAMSWRNGGCGGSEPPLPTTLLIVAA
jgi:hypothetical protein